MSRVVLLDAGPLGLVTNPKHSAQSLACAQWLQGLVARGTQALTLDAPAVVVATTNVGHLSRFVPADLWQNLDSQ